MKIDLMEDLYLADILRLYDAERVQHRTLRELQTAAVSDELRNCLQLHFEETRTQVCRLEEIIATFSAEKKRTDSRVMRAIISEALDVIDSGLDSDLLDAALIGSLMAAESHEVACYASALRIAQALDRADDVSLLARSLQEERSMSNRLVSLAHAYETEAAEAEEVLEPKAEV